VRVHVEGYKPIKMTLMWCGRDIIGAMEYWSDSHKARQTAIKELRNHVDSAIN